MVGRNGRQVGFLPLPAILASSAHPAVERTGVRAVDTATVTQHWHCQQPTSLRCESTRTPLQAAPSTGARTRSLILEVDEEPGLSTCIKEALEGRGRRSRWLFRGWRRTSPIPGREGAAGTRPRWAAAVLSAALNRGLRPQAGGETVKVRLAAWSCGKTALSASDQAGSCARETSRARKA